MNTKTKITLEIEIDVETAIYLKHLTQNDIIYQGSESVEDNKIREKIFKALPTFDYLNRIKGDY